MLGCGSDLVAGQALTRRDNFVEQREHSRLTLYVIDLNEGGRTVTGTQDLISNLVSRIGVMGELVSRRNHCAQTAPLDCAGRSSRYGNTVPVISSHVV